MAMMEMDYNMKSLAKLFKLLLCFFKKIDIYSHSWVSIHILRLYLPLDVQKECFSWVKLPTTDFGTVKITNLQNPCERAPLRKRIMAWFKHHLKTLKYQPLFRKRSLC